MSDIEKQKLFLIKNGTEFNTIMFFGVFILPS